MITLIVFYDSGIYNFVVAPPPSLASDQEPQPMKLRSRYFLYESLGIEFYEPLFRYKFVKKQNVITSSLKCKGLMQIFKFGSLYK